MNIGDFEIVEYNDGHFSVFEKVAWWNTGRREHRHTCSSFAEAEKWVEDYKTKKLPHQAKKRWVLK